MRQLAAKADERWAAQESFLDAPSKQQPAPATGVQDPAGYMHHNQTEPTENEGVRSAVGDEGEVEASTQGQPKDDGRFKGRGKDKDANPWKQAPKGNPGDDWQPQSWTPGVSRR
jgi:NADH dehydrogenase [ubiquinone] 1 alpha subcomplex assembly factor 2